MDIFNIQSFQKHLKKQYSIAPAEARKQKQEIFKEFLENHDTDLKIEIKYKDPATVYCKFIKAKDYNNQEIDALWKEIEPGAEIFETAYGIIRDHPLITSHSHCRYGAAVTSDEGVTGLVKSGIFGGKYARFIHYGPYENILETYRSFYQSWLSGKKFLLGNSDLIASFL